MTDELMHHIHMKQGDVGRYVLLPGDPGRCEKIASYLDDAVLVAENREFVTYTGQLHGEKVSVTSTGVGGPSAAIAIEELHRIGADTFIRVGTSGGMHRDVVGGDIVIATGAIRMEGTSKEYMPIEFPAVSNYDVTNALIVAAQTLGLRHHVGVVECKDSFYGQIEPQRMPVSYELENKWNAWLAGGALASEMESAALFVIGSIIGARVGTVLLAAVNQERAKLGFENSRVTDIDRAIRPAIEAVKILMQRDLR